MPRSTLFIDNGGYNIKALYLPATDTTASSTATHPPHLMPSDATAASSTSAPQMFIMPNCIGAAPHTGSGIMGDQLTSLSHYHGLMVRRPVDRGFVVDGGLQARIWEHVLQHFAIAQETEVDVWVTVPFAAPKAVAQLLWLLFTRSFHFASVTFVSSSFLALIAQGFHDSPPLPVNRPSISTPAKRKRDRDEGNDDDDDDDGGSRSLKQNETSRDDYGATGGTAIVVDVGFSATTVTPYVDYLPVLSSVVRLDVGGKLLTNRLKEFLSFRQVNVMEDTWLINHVRERCCAVSLQPWRSLRTYAALWRGKSRTARETSLARAREQHAGKTVNQNDTYTATATPAAYSGAGSGDAEGGGRELDASRHETCLCDTPIRFYLPTIPALLPLGVLESELPARLPKTAAIDADALQHLLLRHERFLIPELLFTPGDVGLDQHGIVQAVTEGIFQRGLLQHVVTLLRPRLLQRICVYGGVAGTPLLCARLQRDIGAAMPCSTHAEAAESDQAARSTDRAIVEAGKGHEGRRRGRGPDDEDDDGTGGGVQAAAPLPPALKAASATTAATSATAPLRALQPLIGAFHLLTAHATTAPHLARVRELAQRRGSVQLQHPVSGKVTVETLQDALRQAL